MFVLFVWCRESTIHNHWTFYVSSANQCTSMGWKSNEKPKRREKNAVSSKPVTTVWWCQRSEPTIETRKLKHWWMQKSNGMCLICRYYEIQWMQTCRLWNWRGWFVWIRRLPRFFMGYKRISQWSRAFFHDVSTAFFSYISSRLTYAHQSLTPPL